MRERERKEKECKDEIEGDCVLKKKDQLVKKPRKKREKETFYPCSIPGTRQLSIKKNIKEEKLFVIRTCSSLLMNFKIASDLWRVTKTTFLLSTFPCFHGNGN